MKRQSWKLLQFYGRSADGARALERLYYDSRAAFLKPHESMYFDRHGEYLLTNVPLRVLRDMAHVDGHACPRQVGAYENGDECWLHPDYEYTVGPYENHD